VAALLHDKGPTAGSGSVLPADVMWLLLAAAALLLLHGSAAASDGAAAAAAACATGSVFCSVSSFCTAC
jgi:hypothetical protein